MTGLWSDSNSAKREIFPIKMPSINTRQWNGELFYRIKNCRSPLHGLLAISTETRETTIRTITIQSSSTELFAIKPRKTNKKSKKSHMKLYIVKLSRVFPINAELLSLMLLMTMIIEWENGISLDINIVFIVGRSGWMLLPVLMYINSRRQSCATLRHINDKQTINNKTRPEVFHIYFPWN